MSNPALRSDPEGRRLLPDTWRRPVLGVLGGMGPAATVSFLDALIRTAPADRDQDHIDTVVLNHVSTPDRTARLLDDTYPDPTPYLLGDLELLARLGAEAAVILCNTSHAFLPDQNELPLPLLSLIEVGAEATMQVAAAQQRRAPEQTGTTGATVASVAPVVTVLATDGTLRSRVYQEALAARGAQVRVPGEPDQRLVMAMIYDGVKAGVHVATADFLGLVAELGAGADAVLLGCTELSVLAEQAGAAVPAHVVDAQAALVARVLADFAPAS